MRQRLTDWIATILMLGLVPMLVFVMASGALAARPSSATLTVTPNAAQAWSTATGSGCGYTGTEVYIDVHKPEALGFFSIAPDANGCVSFTFNTDGPGTYLLEARQLGHGNHWRVIASYALPVN